MSPSAFFRALVTALGFIALSPPVAIPTHLATAYLPAVAVDADIEDLAARAVRTNAPTNKKDQGDDPFRDKAVDKGRRLWEALFLMLVELPLSGTLSKETPIADDDRGFSLPLKAEHFIRGSVSRDIIRG